MARFRALSLVVFAVLAFTSQPAVSQDYLQATGQPTFTTPWPVELGFVNLGNGNLHAEIPIASFPQRGGIPFGAKLVYDSRIWQITNNAWQPTNVANSWGGWRVVTSVDPGTVTQTVTITNCGGNNLTTYSKFIWTDPNGTKRVFPITTSQNLCTGQNVTSGNAFATDSTGFHMYVTNYTTATIFAKNGNQVFPSSKDTNGNYFSVDGNGNVIDTLGRTPVTKTVNGSQIYYDVLNSQGTTSRFTVTTTTINVKTNFSQTGVTDYTGTITVAQSLGLPDGSSYSFAYDSGTTAGKFGLLKTLTLRTGGQISYVFATFTDAYSNKNRWMSSLTSAGGTWGFSPQVVTTCAQGQVGCTQKVTVTKPSGDQSAFDILLNNGAWNTASRIYNGTAPTTRVQTVATDFDLATPCPAGTCTGAIYIRPTRVTTSYTIPSGDINRKSEFTYDSGQYGNVTIQKEWLYYLTTPPASPDRETDYAYLTTSSYVTKDILNLVTSVTVKNAAATQVALTNYVYDSTSLTSITGVIQHDDSGFGTGNTVRGNATQVQRWVSGAGCTPNTVTCLTTTNVYDTTGQLLQVTNPRGHTASYDYTDSFFIDNGSNPPSAYTPTQATNAFRTKWTYIELPGSASESYAYYFHSGKLTFEEDENQARMYHHYLDSLDRETHVYDRKLINNNRGWRLTAYTSATQTDVYTGITDTTASTSCTGCRHDVVNYDGNGRQIKSTLASDPDGQTFVDTVYDSTSRAQSASNPYRTTTESTYGLESFQYDGLDRTTRNTHADNNFSQTFYGAGVSTGGGATNQLCSATTYGRGYTVLYVDEAGHKSQTWTDGFGRIIEADEPDATGALTVGTCYKYDALDNQAEVDQGTQMRTYVYDGLSRQTLSTEPESGSTSTCYTTATGPSCNSSGTLCSGIATNACSVKDARNITTTYSWSARERLLGMTYSDPTPAVTYTYDDTSCNGLTITYGGGRRTCMTDGAGTTGWSYDPAGHILTEQRTIAGITKTTSFTYNLDGSVATKTFPSGRVLTYTYNNAQRVISIVDTANSVNYAKSGAYAPQGTLASVVHGQVSGGFAGITVTKTYNNRLQLATQRVTSSNGTVLDLTYGYDLGGGVNNGNVVSVANNKTGAQEGPSRLPTIP